MPEGGLVMLFENLEQKLSHRDHMMATPRDSDVAHSGWEMVGLERLPF